MTQPMILQPQQMQFTPVAPYAQQPAHPMTPPSVNAVKIDIINPQAYGSGMQQAQAQQPAQYYYNYPQAQYYPIPPMMPPMPQIPQFPAYQMPQQPAQFPQTTTMMPTQIGQPLVIPGTSTEPPIIINPPQMPVMPPAPTAIEPQAAPQPAAAEAKAPAEAPQAKPAETVKTPTAVDLTGLKTKLASSNLEDQINAIQEIIHIGKNEPERADQLLDVDVINGLLDIMKKDNSSLPAPTPEQIAARDKAVDGAKITPEEKALAEVISPLETAEMNKTFAIFALAILQKHFMEKVDQDYKAQLAEIKKNDPNSTAQPDIQPVELKDVPGLAQVVETAKQNPNPVIRENAIQALAYIARPQDKAILTDVFKIATTDSNPIVKAAAEEALATISKLPDTPNATPAQAQNPAATQAA